MYYHNAPSGPSPGPGLVPYIEFPYREFMPRSDPNSRWPCITLGFGSSLTVSGKISAQTVISILTAVRDAIRQVHLDLAPKSPDLEES